MDNVILRGGRIELTAPGSADIDTITRHCQDPAIQRWTTVPSPYARADAEHFVNVAVPKGWEDGTSLTWVIRSAGNLVGMVDLHHLHEGAGEIGYWMAAEHRGAHLMSGAVTLVCDYGFSSLNLQRIQWCAYVGNIASASVARRAGFRYEGLLRMEGLQRGIRHDSWFGGLLPSDDRVPGGQWPI